MHERRAEVCAARPEGGEPARTQPLLEDPRTPAVPAGLSESGLPLGLQLIGRAFDEETLFRAGSALERAAGFDARPTKWWTP